MAAPRVGLKFCGGCDPAYDRDRYWTEMKKAAAGRIRFVGPVGEGAGVVLVLSACRTACPMEEMVFPAGVEVVSVTDDSLPAEAVVERLIELVGVSRNK